MSIKYVPRLLAAQGKEYAVLLKPRVMSLVVFTATTGLMVAPGHISFIKALIAIVCIALGGGASGALNMWYDADIDAVMKRTKNRPIPAGKIAASHGLFFGLLLATFSVVAMGMLINWAAAFLLAFTIFFYAVIYTIWLKRSTPQNIVIGGAAGAFPPMIGWTAVTGHIDPQSVVLFLIIFLWTPPHFWALSLFTTGDYAAAKIPMMPNIRGERSTKNQIFFYSVLMAGVSLLPYVLHFAGPFYLVSAIALSSWFVVYAWYLWKTEDEALSLYWSKRLFFLSLFYLAALFGVLFLEASIKSLHLLV